MSNYELFAPFEDRCYAFNAFEDNEEGVNSAFYLDDVDIDDDHNDDDNTSHQSMDEMVMEDSSDQQQHNDSNEEPFLIRLLRASDWSMARQRIATHPHEAQWKDYCNNETALHAAFTSTGSDGDNLSSGMDGGDGDGDSDIDNEEDHTHLQLNIHVPSDIIQDIMAIAGAKSTVAPTPRGASVIDLILLSWCDVMKVVGGGQCAVKDNDLQFLPPVYEYELRKQAICYILSNGSDLNDASTESASLPSSTMEYLWSWIFHSNRFFNNYRELDAVVKYLGEDTVNDNETKLGRSENTYHSQPAKKKRKKIKMGKTNDTNENDNQCKHNKVAAYVQFFISIMDVLLSHAHEQKCHYSHRCVNNLVIESNPQHVQVPETQPKESTASRQKRRTPQTKTIENNNTTNVHKPTLLHVLLQLYNRQKSSSVPILILQLVIKSSPLAVCGSSFDERGNSPLIVAITSKESHWNNSGDRWNQNQTTMAPNVSFSSSSWSSPPMSRKVTVMKAILDHSPGCSSIPNAKTQRLPLHIALDYSDCEHEKNSDTDKKLCANDQNDLFCRCGEERICLCFCTKNNGHSTTTQKRLTWDSGISLLVHDSPHVLCEKDTKTGLYAFALAAAGTREVAVAATTTASEDSADMISDDDIAASDCTSSTITSMSADDRGDVAWLNTIYQLLLFNPTVVSRDPRMNIRDTVKKIAI